MEDTTKETVSTNLASKPHSKARAKAKQTATTMDLQGITREMAPAHTRAKAKARDCRESVTITVKQIIPQGVARAEEKQKEKEIVTKAKAKDRGAGLKQCFM